MSLDETRETPDVRRRRWVTTRELQAYLGGTSKNMITRYIQAGMPAHQPITRGRYLFDLDQVDAWIDSRCSTRPAGDAA